MIKAKEVLGDHLCLMGNLDLGLTAMGSPEDVMGQCRKLIENCGEGGGFILSSACEVPINAPFENILSIKKAVEEYGWYR